MEAHAGGTPRVREIEDALAARTVLPAVAEPYELKWKVLNRGAEAERRDSMRGQIVDSSKPGVRIERSDFKGARRRVLRRQGRDRRRPGPHRRPDKQHQR